MTVVGVVIKSARDLWPVVALMLLMMFVFTVLGMQLFGAKINPSLESYAAESYALTTRFDTFYWSFVQVGESSYRFPGFIDSSRKWRVSTDGVRKYMGSSGGGREVG